MIDTMIQSFKAARLNSHIAAKLEVEFLRRNFKISNGLVHLGTYHSLNLSYNQKYRHHLHMLRLAG